MSNTTAKSIVDSLNLAEREGLLRALQPYLTSERNARFDEVLSYRTEHFAIGIEDVFQEHNAGALLRTCDCFGIQNAHVIEQFNSLKVSKTISKGADKWIDRHFYRSENAVSEMIDTSHKLGYQVVATTPHTNDVSLPDFDISTPSVFVFGAEKHGISDAMIAKADAFLKIPMVGFTESFNVSVAAALILNDVTTRLRRSDIDWKLKEDRRTALKLEWTINTLPKGIRFTEELMKRIDLV